jgi:hypothetical protein
MVPVLIVVDSVLKKFHGSHAPVGFGADQEVQIDLLRTNIAFCRVHGDSLHPRNGNWKIATRDRSQKLAPQEPKCQKLRTRDWGTPA